MKKIIIGATSLFIIICSIYVFTIISNRAALKRDDNTFNEITTTTTTKKITSKISEKEEKNFTFENVSINNSTKITTVSGKVKSKKDYKSISVTLYTYENGKEINKSTVSIKDIKKNKESEFKITLMSSLYRDDYKLKVDYAEE